MNVKFKIRGNIHMYNYHDDNIGNRFPFQLQEDVTYAIGVDPSTTTTAIVIGNMVDKKADVLIELTRDIEIDDTEFNKAVYTIVSNFMEEWGSQIEAVTVEKPFKHKYTTNVKFSKQRANFNMWESLCSKNEIDFYDVSPQSWRGSFTRKYSNRIRGDKRKVSKATIKSIYGGQECLDLLQFSTDTSDAYGIYQYYLEKYAGGYKAAVELEREYRHDIIYNIVDISLLEEFTDRYVKVQQSKGHKSLPTVFEYCDDLSPEDNIRCFTSVRTSKRYNVYCTAFFPSIGNIRFLYRYRRNIPKLLDKNTQLCLIGYRVN